MVVAGVPLVSDALLVSGALSSVSSSMNAALLKTVSVIDALIAAGGLMTTSSSLVSVMILSVVPSSKNAVAFCVEVLMVFIDGTILSFGLAKS